MGVALVLVIEGRKAPRPPSEALRRGPRPRASTAVVTSPLGGDSSPAAVVEVSSRFPLPPPDGNEVARPGRRPVAWRAHPSSRRGLGRPRRYPRGTRVGPSHPVIPTPLRAEPVAAAGAGVAPMATPAALRPAPREDHPKDGPAVPVARPLARTTRQVMGRRAPRAIARAVTPVRLVVRACVPATTTQPPAPTAAAPAALRAEPPTRATAAVALPASTARPAVGPVAPFHGTAVILPVATVAPTPVLPVGPVPARPGPVIRVASLRLDSGGVSVGANREKLASLHRPKNQKEGTALTTIKSNPLQSPQFASQHPYC